MNGETTAPPPPRDQSHPPATAGTTASAPAGRCQYGLCWSARHARPLPPYRGRSGCRHVHLPSVGEYAPPRPRGDVRPSRCNALAALAAAAPSWPREGRPPPPLPPPPPPTPPPPPPSPPPRRRAAECADEGVTPRRRRRPRQHTVDGGGGRTPGGGRVRPPAARTAHRAARPRRRKGGGGLPPPRDGEHQRITKSGAARNPWSNSTPMQTTRMLCLVGGASAARRMSRSKCRLWPAIRGRPIHCHTPPPAPPPYPPFHSIHFPPSLACPASSPHGDPIKRAQTRAAAPRRERRPTR